MNDLFAGEQRPRRRAASKVTQTRSKPFARLAQRDELEQVPARGGDDAAGSPAEITDAS